jgi:hypothetical protein
LEEGLVYGSAHYQLKKLGGLFTETKRPPPLWRSEDF